MYLCTILMKFLKLCVLSCYFQLCVYSFVSCPRQIRTSWAVCRSGCVSPISSGASGCKTTDRIQKKLDGWKMAWVPYSQSCSDSWWMFFMSALQHQHHSSCLCNMLLNMNCWRVELVYRRLIISCFQWYFLCISLSSTDCSSSVIICGLCQAWKSACSWHKKSCKVCNRSFSSGLQQRYRLMHCLIVFH